MAEEIQSNSGPTNSVASHDTERPAIHVSLADGLDRALFNWVAIGAEEEGVPCRQVPTQHSDPTAIAYDAAVSSRFGVGVGIAGRTVVVHELHMPPEQPVLVFKEVDGLPGFCRLAGSNAARLIIRLPFRFELESEMPVEANSTRNPQPVSARNSQNKPSPGVLPPDASDLSPETIAAIAKVVARIVKERGML
jgi:hypothetical protein